MRLNSPPILLHATAIFLGHMGGCASTPPPEEEMRYVTAFFPEQYDRSERIAGAAFGSRLGIKMRYDASNGIARYDVDGRTTDVPSPRGDRRPFLRLRLTGPKGTIEGDFVFATGFGGTISIPPGDAEALGLVRHASAKEVSLVRKTDVGDVPRRCYQAPVAVEVAALGLNGTLPAIWAPPEEERLSTIFGPRE